MATAVRTKTMRSVQAFNPDTHFIMPNGEVKRLSKIGIWRRQNPDGMIIVNDRRAVNR